MAALTKDRTGTLDKAGGGNRHGTRKVAANAIIYFKALIALNAAGYVVAATDAAARKVIGLSEEFVDNTGGADGAKSVAYVTGISAKFVNAGGAIVQANLGRGCYVADDQSVTTRDVSVNKVFVGIVEEFTAAEVWAFVDEAHIGVLGDEQVGNILATGIGIPLIATFALPDAAGDVDIVVPEKCEVLDAWTIKTGANGGAVNTVQIKNAANAITNALDINVNDQTITRAGTIDDAQSTIAAGGTLRATTVKAGGNAAAKLQVVYAKRA